jgi:Transglycosylase SLT domain/SPOR domain
MIAGAASWLPKGMMVLLLAATASSARGEAATESPDQALCRLIERSARRHSLPLDFFTRLIWRESSFRATVVSSAGAQGIAQFMPGTAAERGLADPFDPEQAIPASAHLLDELNRRFGSLGLAAAAYNAGPTRVADWLSGKRGLPFETQDYVFFITGRQAEEFRGAAEPAITKPSPPEKPSPSNCLQLAAGLRRETPARLVATTVFAPWGVQLSGAFSKSVALASFGRAQQRYSRLIGDLRPMVIGTRLRSRGTRVFYRVRAPAATRQEATKLCDRVRAAGGACIVLRS